MTITRAAYVLDCDRCHVAPELTPPDSPIAPRGIRTRAWKAGWLTVDDALDYCPACVAECGLQALGNGTAPPFETIRAHAHGPGATPRHDAPKRVTVYVVTKNGEPIEVDGEPVPFESKPVAQRLAFNLNATSRGAVYGVTGITAEMKR